VAVGQYGFALEEAGRYTEAEAWGRLGLELEPEDCWSMHCLAHVFEEQNRHLDGMGLLKSHMPVWREQNLLDAHIWWHLALRLVEAEEFDAALDLFDEQLIDIPANNQFRLTDSTSLLWRLELAGVKVGNRWQAEADKWAGYAETHSNPFLDMHAALAFASASDHVAADRFFDSLTTAHLEGNSEVAEIFRTVVHPLVEGLRLFPRDKKRAAIAFEAAFPAFHRVGGSVVQRQIVERSYSCALLATGEYVKSAQYLDEKLKISPNKSWLLRDRAKAAERSGDVPAATLYARRADLMLASWN
ncbi:MAG: tetratricopeptide repeat protein, partial [Pseudomonadota bacterium]